MIVKYFQMMIIMQAILLLRILLLVFLIAVFDYHIDTPINDQVEMYKDGDLRICNAEGHELLFETERKIEGWNLSGKWATVHNGEYKVWKTIDIPYRKSQNKSYGYILFNKHFDTLAYTKMQYVLTSRIYKKDTIYTNDEVFYAIHPILFMFYTKNDENKWIRIDIFGNQLD